MVVVSTVDILYISCCFSAISALITAFELVFAITSCAVVFAFLFLSIIVHFPIIGMFVLLDALNSIWVFLLFLVLALCFCIILWLSRLLLLLYQF